MLTSHGRTNNLELYCLYALWENCCLAEVYCKLCTISIEAGEMPGKTLDHLSRRDYHFKKSVEL